ASRGDLVWYHMQNQISIKVDDSDNGIDDNAVILSTIHGSKGLQYDTVYLIACHNKNWEDRDQRGMMKVPDLLNRYISPEADSLDDMRKLIYVACTRAETELHVSMNRKTYSDKDITNTTLLDSFGTANGITIEVVNDFELPELETTRYKVETDPELMQLIKEKLETFEISPTSTGVWVKCQNEFFFTQILKVGGFFNEAAAFGTVVHNVLQHYADNENRNRELINTLVDQEINKQKHLFHSTHVDKYRQYAKWLIPDYLRKNPILRKPDHLEVELHAIISDEVKIKGKMDRIEINGDSVKVIDYKTGRYKESLRAYENNTEPGSQYWRQAMMYSMLVRSNFQDKKNIDFEFHYPEIDNGIYPFNEPDNILFNEWLGEIWDQTQQLEFDQVCENPSCVYCAARLI
ncbi:MAG: PD-(D/E)XK nuclease family protein, partial [bacterium]